MISERRLHRECWRKVKYASKERAEIWIQYRFNSYDRPRLHAYECIHCGGWHIGHKLPEVIRAELGED